MKKNIIGKRVSKVCDAFPSIFFTRFADRDAAVLKGNGARFSRRLIIGAVQRCSHGFPQVLLCKPLRDMKPFPTSFWLSCPYLAALIGRLESDGGIHEIERTSAGAEGQWRKYHATHALLRLALIGRAQRAYLRRHRRSVYRAICGRGIGGASYSGGTYFAKCLHLHAASYLALGRHPASRWLALKIGEFECKDARCASKKI